MSAESVKVKVDVEYCDACSYHYHCLDLSKKITSSIPEASVICKKGRHGSFEVAINDQLVYSKLRTMALPDYNEVLKVIEDVAIGGPIKEVKKQQPIYCAIS